MSYVAIDKISNEARLDFNVLVSGAGMIVKSCHCAQKLRVPRNFFVHGFAPLLAISFLYTDLLFGHSFWKFGGSDTRVATF